MEEQWARIAEFPQYEVSSSGRIRRDGHQIKPFIGGRCYRCFSPCTGGNQKTVRIAPVMLKTFSGARPDNQVSRHLNGISTDDRIENLAWGTQAQNMADAIEVGVIVRGEDHWASRLTTDSVKAIRVLAKDGHLHESIATQYGVARTTIRDVVNRKTWKHVD